MTPADGSDPDFRGLLGALKFLALLVLLIVALLASAVIVYKAGALAIDLTVR